MARRPWPRHAGHATKCAVRFDRGRERRHEPGLPERVESVLPPQPGDAKRVRPPLDPRLDPPNETIAEQDRQDVVAPATLRGWNVDLPDVVEAVEAAQEVAVPDQWIERGQKRDPGRRPAGRRSGRDLSFGLLEE